jgi:hypothetical protein
MSLVVNVENKLLIVVGNVTPLRYDEMFGSFEDDC